MSDDQKPDGDGIYARTAEQAGPLRMIPDPTTGVPSMKIEFRHMPSGLTAAAVQMANGDWLCLCQCATPVLKFPAACR